MTYFVHSFDDTNNVLVKMEPNDVGPLENKTYKSPYLSSSLAKKDHNLMLQVILFSHSGSCRP